MIHYHIDYFLKKMVLDRRFYLLNCNPGTGGQANLFDVPEFADLRKIKKVVQTLEDKTLLAAMLESVTLASGVKVVIGEENNIESMKCCSLIASAYNRGEDAAGTLGLIGPIRQLGWRFVTLDLAGFKSGSLNPASAEETEGAAT